MNLHALSRAAGLATAVVAATAQTPTHENTVHYRTVSVDGVDIFYREAGRPDAPTLVLLHGFPTSSQMYRGLIPLLAGRFHVLPPTIPATATRRPHRRNAMPTPSTTWRRACAVFSTGLA